VSLTESVKTQRGPATRLGILSAFLLFSLFRPVITARTKKEIPGLGLLDAFKTARWIAIPVLVALLCYVLIKQHARARVAAVGVALAIAVWLVIGYWTSSSKGASNLSPAAGWVIPFAGAVFVIVSNLGTVLGRSPSFGKLVGGVGKSAGPVVGRREFPIAVAVALAAVLMFVIPPWLGAFWVSNLTQAAIVAIVAASAGLLYGRVGLVSLGQVAPYGIGTWVTMRLAYATDLPYIGIVLIAGVVAMLIGVLIGLPALRVSGLYLALVTLMLVAGVEITLSNLQFPNGGSGFSGVVTDIGAITDMRRPSFATSDTAYFRFAVIGSLIMLLFAGFVLMLKPGRAWASIRQSEAAALSAGIDVTRYKVYAFALASFMAGVAGGLFAGSITRGMSIDSFSRVNAIFIIAAVIMGGIYSLWGGVVAAFLATCLVKFLSQNVVGHSFWQNFALSLFGFGLLMNLVQSTAKAEKKGVEA
jgi:branched-chain amino acid transport system permease protein